jgi:hypothetical protein
MRRSAALGVAMILVLAPAAAGRASTLRPRIGRAMGIVAPFEPPETAVTPREPTVFHGGTVMRDVHVHTVFWAPAGYGFSGSPGAGAPGYEPLQQRFLADAAHDSGSPGNLFSILSAYGDTAGPGKYALAYSAAADSIDDTAPYPAAAHQCASPGGVTTCLTDLELERELDRVIAQHDPAGRGLHDLWLIFLPPDVDTCVSPDNCGTNAYGGYHSLFDLGHGETIYAVIVDPLVEGVSPPGADPQGNPDGELAVDVVAHETVEAITDPEGTGWMDPDGYEVGDKCESQYGPPLGYAPNGSPYDQVLGGHEYLIQTMWANAVSGCVEHAAPQPAPAVPRVDLRQFSARLSGNIGSPKAGIAVAALLIKGGIPVALAGARTGRHGGWRATLRTIDTGAPVPVGDDRDELLIHYGRGGPGADLISTDSGGDPFAEAGWTGWFDLDHGAAVRRRAVALAPCGQTGVITLRVGRVFTASPMAQCQTETDVAVLATHTIGASTPITLTSMDNRAAGPSNGAGALVRLAVSLGEPGSVSSVTNREVQLRPTGFPTCTADLRSGRVRCAGLVPRGRYTLHRARGHAVLASRAARDGVAAFGSFAGAPGIRGGDTLTLRNRSGRAVTALHLAHLRVDIRGSDSVLAGGTCEPAAYWGPPVAAPPVGSGIGDYSVGGSGRVCPLSGHAAGLPDRAIEQTDPFSGGVTRTEVPELGSISPTPGETVYGRFVALAQPVLPGAHGGTYPVPARVSLAIARRGSRHVLVRAADVQRAQGVSVAGLTPGVYTAVWTLTDPAGDTRTVTSDFIQEG